MIRDGMEAFVKMFLDEDPKVSAVGLDATQARIRARMDWLDAQDAEFRALVHDVGLNRACREDGRRPPV